MEHSIKISKDACQGCVNCIRVCPTEAIRVVNGEISIIEELCVDCGECLRSCTRSALGIYEDDWNRIKESSRVTIIPDPAFFSQFSHYSKPNDLENVLISLDLKPLIDEAEEAFDLVAYAIAQLINRSAKTALPLVSVYCPAILKLIQTKYPELLSRVVPVRSPLEIAGTLWRMKTNSEAPVTLLAPCPAKITMVREPPDMGISPLTYGVTVRKVARSIMAESEINLEKGATPRKRKNRWIQWSRRRGESRHIQAFSERKLTTLSVSGMRNTLDILQELELGRLRGVDFIECRVCDTGCVGGVGTADSRFLANLRLENIEADWSISPKELSRAEELFATDIWSVTKEYQPRPRLPLSDNVADAMIKLQQMKEIYNGLPHIDCGSCGRPSCQAMAEEIVRGHGLVTDCIFKRREGITALASQIIKLSESQSHTLKRKDEKS